MTEKAQWDNWIEVIVDFRKGKHVFVNLVGIIFIANISVRRSDRKHRKANLSLY